MGNSVRGFSYSKIEADKIRHSDLSNQWRKNVCKGSSFHHHDVILVEETAAARGGIYLIMIA
jgi:hypothetical protein